MFANDTVAVSEAAHLELPEKCDIQTKAGTIPPQGRSYDQMTPKTWAFGVLMVLLAILGISVWLIVPNANPLLTVFLYSIPANCAISLFPHEPLLVDFGTSGLNIWAIALAATLGTFVAGVVDYKVFAPVLNLKRSADRYRTRKYYLKADHWFSKSPFLTLVVAGFSPLPFYPFKFLVFATRYPLKRYLAALLIGRLPRYYLLTLVGYQLNPPTWVILGTFVAMFLIVSSGKIVQLARTGVSRLFGKRNC